MSCTEYDHKYEKGEFTEFRWENKEAHTVSARFLPFSVHCVAKSFKLTSDTRSVFPAASNLRVYYEEVFETPRRFSVWEIKPYFAVPILFPNFTQNVVVEKALDGVGICSEIFGRPERLTNESLGYYHVDFEKRVVTVYPRYHYRGDFYEYKIGVEFCIPPENVGLEAIAVKEHWLPYRYEEQQVIGQITVPHGWSLDITGNVEVRFILPPDAELLIQESGNPTLGYEDDRSVAEFVLNSPRTLSPTRWQVVYDIVPLRNFFWLEVASILSFLSVWLGIVVFRLPSKLSLGIVTAFSFPLFSFNLYSFLSLGGQKSLLSLLFLFEVVLLILINATYFKKYGNVSDGRAKARRKKQQTRKKRTYRRKVIKKDQV